MSEFIGDTPENYEGDNTNDDLNTFEADPATVAFLDQQAAEFREMADKFEEYHGFRHECVCDKDYAAGKVVEVTECFASMVIDSLETCARLNMENKALRDMLNQMFQLSNAIADPAQEVEVGSAGDSGSVEGTPEASVGGTGEADSGTASGTTEVA